MHQMLSSMTPIFWGGGAKKGSPLEHGGVCFFFFSEGCSFFAYSWKLPAYSGAYLLTSNNVSLFTYSGSFFNYILSFFYVQLELFGLQWEVRLISALRDCKQRSLTVSKKTPTVSRKASPLFFFSARISELSRRWSESPCFSTLSRVCLASLKSLEKGTLSKQKKLFLILTTDWICTLHTKGVIHQSFDQKFGPPQLPESRGTRSLFPVLYELWRFLFLKSFPTTFKRLFWISKTKIDKQIVKLSPHFHPCPRRILLAFCSRALLHTKGSWACKLSGKGFSEAGSRTPVYF